MERHLNLIEGNITNALVKLALPIMGTSFIQMAYTLTDIMWLGRLSTGAVAAAGTAGFFLWFGAGLILISQIGMGTTVAQSYGRGEIEEAKHYISNGFQLDFFIGIIYSLFLYIFREDLISFFNIDSIEVHTMAIEYIRIISMGIIFYFLNPIFSTVLNSTGNSVTPFRINTMGLIFNIILDPILIFGIGPINGMGIKGAAIATISSQFIVSIIFIIVGKKTNSLYSKVKLFKKPELSYIKKITKLGFPAFLQSSVHSGIGMILTRVVAGFGSTAIAVQSIGSQIESLTWMTSEGFSAAMGAFVGQNYGAGKHKRIKEGYKKGMQIIGSIGMFATILFVLFPRYLFSIFVPNDPLALKEGAIYLRVLGISQLFMSIEIGTAGAFNGLGKTIPPAIISIVLNALRIPIAIILSTYTTLGLNGVWWSVSVTSIIKGIILSSLFIRLLRKDIYNDGIILKS
ncbi:MATE family efflux transporter [Tissierella creatinophila]|uniref:Probable multidrug resistance protein NorM n=1 Tax=Tissierella creatinophila DSM 6911 TaxID=1123403 RepID=A0A1U7M466_TISCR|nr:MATE family efflux transporter [Tissierella creatinophila]OLS02040.1 multidrug export protein MepA [Tissierella creatinophila DSM 6911]